MSGATNRSDISTSTDELKRPLLELAVTKPINPAEEKTPPSSAGGGIMSTHYADIVVAVVLYWSVSITLVFVNKSLLSGSVKLDAPLFITWFQCLITVGACYALRAISVASKGRFKFPELSLSPATCRKVLPLSAVFVAMITCNNLCLKYVGISFYYIGRSLTTVFNVAATYLLLGQKTSFQAVGCCAIILFGFWLGVEQEGESGSFSLAGTIFGVLASLFVSLYSINTKKVLPLVGDNIWLLTFYNNVNAVALFLPLMVGFGEVSSIATFSHLSSLYFWSLMIAGGFFGFAIGYVTGLQIKVTSPLTHNVSGTAKAAFQTVLATQVNAELKTFWWWISNAVVLLGSALYARVKHQEMAKAAKTADHSPQPPPPPRQDSKA